MGSKFSSDVSASLKSQLQLGDPVNPRELNELLQAIESESITTSSPYFMNQLFAGIVEESLLVESLLARTRTTMATFEASPVFSLVEREVVRSLVRLFDWPEGEGIGVPGGSAANFMAIHCARHRVFPTSKEQGFFIQTLPPMRVFVSEQAHYSFNKACAVLGVGTDNLISVPVDSQGQMRVSCLVELINESIDNGFKPLMVAATAGTTVFGAFDPIAILNDVCKQKNIWLHVDAAWGGPVAFSEREKEKLLGIEFADSVTFDAHKLLGASLTASFFLTRHKGILRQANDVAGGDYLFHSQGEQIDRGRLSWQCGRGAESLRFWTLWKRFGSRGLGERLEKLLAVRDEVVIWIKNHERLQLVCEPSYLNVCVRVLPSNKESVHRDWSTHVREILKNENMALVNFASDKQGSFLRLILAHPELRAQHVIDILKSALRVQ